MIPNVLKPIDASGLCQVFGTAATTVTVVTTRSEDGVPHAAMASTFTPVSLDPPLAQVTLPRTARAARYLAGAPFAVNVLSIEQLDVALHFAGEVAGEQPEWIMAGEAPVLKRNAATLACRPWNIYDGGDHIIVVGEVIGMEITIREPLLFRGGEFHRTGRRAGQSRGASSVDAPGEGWYAGSSSFMQL